MDASRCEAAATEALAALQAAVESIPAEDRAAVLESIRDALHPLHPNADQPIDRVRWVPHEMVEPNDYNPNSVAHVEMGLLLRSIDHDGYTQPVVTIWDPDLKKYVIVDGFHRYFVMKSNQEVYDRCHGLLPIVVIDKDINDRMAATVRHNRARGKHSVGGMANMVFKMLDNGMADEDICNELGMEPEELLRLKHITGFSKLFEDHEYARAWMSRNQVEVRQRHRQKVAEEAAAAAAEPEEVATGG